MEQTSRWMAPFLVIAIVAVLTLSLTVTFTGPSGIVIPSGNHQSWRLYAGQRANMGGVGGSNPTMRGATAPSGSHVRVAPGRYVLLIDEAVPANCFVYAEVDVSPRRWAKPTRWMTPSCSVQ